jgi:hypothetical protein
VQKVCVESRRKRRKQRRGEEEERRKEKRERENGEGTLYKVLKLSSGWGSDV